MFVHVTICYEQIIIYIPSFSQETPYFVFIIHVNLTAFLPSNFRAINISSMYLCAF